MEWVGAESASGALEFAPIATTRMMCPSGSHDQKVMRDLPYVRSYLLKDGKLYLFLMADGGIYEFIEQSGHDRQH